MQPEYRADEISAFTFSYRYFLSGDNNQATRTSYFMLMLPARQQHPPPQLN